MSVTCIALDFDFCSATFKDGFEGLYAIFEKRGVSRAKAIELKIQAVRLGFTIATYQSLVEHTCGVLPDRENIKQEFTKWLERTLIPYPDAPVAFASWHTKAPIVSMTFGNDTYQRQKIKATRLPYSEICVVEPPNTKLAVIQGLLLRYGAPFVFIEDNPSELDAVRKAGIGEKSVRTVRVLRSDSPYANIPSEYKHEEVGSFLDIVL